MSDNSLQDIKDRLDIVEVIGGYIPIKKSGANFKAVCPFHNEKSASLVISAQKQIWHCFGCGEGGDLFGFVMRYENLEFVEALNILADKAGVTLPQRSGNFAGYQNKTKELIRINEFTAKFFQKALQSQSGEKAREYLRTRGLTPQTLEQWQIGLAPAGFDNLVEALHNKKVELSLASEAGVLVKNEQSKIFDRFRNRITFPIFSYTGEIIAFTARALSEDDGAKYINSPETAIYNKSKILFGLNFAKEQIRQVDEVVVVEGQMDCISAHQASFNNTVATSGTALTEHHLKLLGKLTKNIKFCFDADDAGLKALRRAGELALPQGFKIKVIELKDVKDPDELIKRSPGLWKKAVSESVWFIDYYLKIAKNKFEFGTVEQKSYLSEQVIPLLKLLQDPLEQDHYIRKIQQDFDIAESAIRNSLKEPIVTTSSRESQAPDTPPDVVNIELVREKEMLGGLLVFPEYLTFVMEEGLPTEYISPDMRDIINKVLIGEKEFSTEQLTLANEAQFMIESNIENLANNELAYIRELKKSFYLFKLDGIKKQLQNTTIALKKAESQHEDEKVKLYNQEFAQLSAQRYVLEQKLEA